MERGVLWAHGIEHGCPVSYEVTGPGVLCDTIVFHLKLNTNTDIRLDSFL